MKNRDLTGMRFGRLTVVAKSVKAGNTTRRDNLWLCRCDCGNEKTVRTSSLRSGNTTSCGCSRRTSIELIGKRFGRLVVIGVTFNPTSTGICQCDCGNERKVLTHSLQSGSTRSCGCLASDHGTEQGIKNRKYEISDKEFMKTDEYIALNDIFHAMHNRCLPSSFGASNYHNRGVRVCDEWARGKENSLQNFIDWARDKWFHGAVLDKEAVDHNNLIYSPVTCRFVSPSDNAASKRPRVNNTSGVLGVNKVNNKWLAKVKYKGKVLLHERFDSIKEAAEARNTFIKANNLPHRLTEYDEHQLK